MENTKQKQSLALNVNDQTKVVHVVPSVFDHLISFLNECRKTGRFCDWILKSEDGLSLQVHRIVLISTCPYFRAMFNSGLSECRQESLLIKNVSGVCLQLIIDYVYTGEIELTIKSAEDILNISNYMCLTYLSKFCLKFLIENIKYDNCLELWKFSAKIDNNEMKRILKKRCLRFILKNLQTLQDNISFMIDLEFEGILNLLLANKDVHENDEQICSFAMKWIATDFKSRSLHIKTIMDKIQFNGLEESFLTDEILGNGILLESKEFLLKMTEVLKGKLGSKETSINENTEQTELLPITDDDAACCSTENSPAGKDNEGEEFKDDDDDTDAISKEKFKIVYNNICTECQLCETWQTLKIE